MIVTLHYTDEKLISAIRDPLELNQAIQWLYRQYAGTVSSFIIHYGGSAQDAQDVFQETVVAFIELVKAGRFRKEASVKTLLVSIARNVWFNDIRRKERSGERDKRYQHAQGQQDLDVSETMVDLELKRQLSQLLDQMGDPCRKILLMFYYENLSMKEMTAHLPYENEQVVRNKKYKCLQYLTSLIKDHPAMATQIKELIK
jgi:RNA polymerase sigma factor (sigma-70 family)